jgi:LAO/AO transport system kinase
VDGLIARFRQRGDTVGVLAVDPTSPRSGGAFLGDRIRMSRHGADDGVFIHSLATRGHLGGISRAVLAATWALDAAGFDRIVIESVGAGQGDVEISAIAHTTVLVVVPEAGDQIQALKAGLVEAADIVAVNKADLPGARLMAQVLEATIGARDRAAGRWRPPVLLIAAATGSGLDVLDRSIDDHLAHLRTGGESAKETERRCRDLLMNVLTDAVRAAVIERCGGELEIAVRRLAEGASDPFTEVERLLREVVRG